VLDHWWGVPPPGFHLKMAAQVLPRHSSARCSRVRGGYVRSLGPKMADTALDGSRDYDGSGNFDKEHVMRSKLAMEMMQWQMARLNPRQ
jgi:hypothetical protein